MDRGEFVESQEAEAPLRLSSRGFEFPQEVIEASGRIAAALRGQQVDLKEGDFKIAIDAVEKWISTKNKPGEGNEEGTPPADWKPCGKAEGVIHLGALVDEFGIGLTSGEMDGRKENQKRGHKKYYFKSLNRQAFRYLKPAEVLERVKRKNPAGLAKINFDKLAAHIPGVAIVSTEIREHATREGRPIHAWFTVSDAGIDAIQPRHAYRWIVRKVEDGIWALFYA